MIGFAASPGTDVDPTCSIVLAASPSAPRIRSASRSKRAGQAGSYSWSVTAASCGRTSPTVYRAISSSVRSPGSSSPLMPPSLSAGRSPDNRELSPWGGRQPAGPGSTSASPRRRSRATSARTASRLVAPNATSMLTPPRSDQ